MAIKAGLVGLPNVGKSTLFNALTKSSIPAQNFPFCTITPNVAVTPVPDKRLRELLRVFNSKEIIPSFINFVDIAGLVKGAAQGQGLGNQFLSHIMEVDLIIHVLRCFEDDNILHVNNKISPLDDFDVILAELMLKDLESLEKRDAKLVGLIKKTNDAKAKKLLEEEQKFNEKLKTALNQTDHAAVMELAKQAKDVGVVLNPLLATKNFLIAANFAEADLQNKAFESTKAYQDLTARFGVDRVIPVSAKIEEDLSRLSDEEQAEMRQMLELDDTGLNHLVLKTFAQLSLITFFTCGPKEIHAWEIKAGTPAPAAAGEIHSDLERGFICAEVYNYTDLVAYGTEQAVKNAGKIRSEGRDYIMKDGDIVLVRFNV